ncbi:MAG TPA: hypothetical protein VK784_07845, partial [Pseudonocardiaceae bacterium]|nr:hypothetical protein [Pseudonocardiaceae bacterium]
MRSLLTDGAAVGQKRHHAVETDHEMIAGSRYTVEAERNITGTVDVLKAFGATGQFTFTFSLTGTSAVSYTSGYDIVSDAKRAPRYEALSSYFDFLGAKLKVTVRRKADDRGRTATLPLKAVRVAFPSETTPEKKPGDPPGAFRATPRLLPGSKRFGYTPAEQAADPSGSQKQAADRVKKVLHHVLNEPEWAGSLKDLRDKVFDLLRQDGQLDKDVIEAVEIHLSESAVMRGYSDMFGDAGAVSPMIRDSKGNNIGQLVIQAEVATIQPSWINHLGIKEESQRFTNAWDTKEHSGAAVGTVGLTFGNGGSKPGAPPELVGASNEFKGAVQAGLSLSASREHASNTGSGDIRGMVIWGNSVLYMTDVRFKVRLVRPSDTFQTVRKAESTVKMGLRVPGISRDRFETLLERAHTGVDDGKPLPVDDEPDESRPIRYPPESMAAGVGIGFSMAVAMQGAEAVMPEVLDMIQHQDAAKAWARDWTPAELTYVQSQLAPRFTKEALTSHAAMVFQPGGVRTELFRPARSGWEIITVTVKAKHGDEPTALGRVKEATLEVMPSAFAGQ